MMPCRSLNLTVPVWTTGWRAKSLYVGTSVQVPFRKVWSRAKADTATRSVIKTTPAIEVVECILVTQSRLKLGRPDLVLTRAAPERLTCSTCRVQCRLCTLRQCRIPGPAAPCWSSRNCSQSPWLPAHWKPRCYWSKPEEEDCVYAYNTGRHFGSRRFYQ